MIILIGSQKGGSDKSTTAVNISAWLVTMAPSNPIVNETQEAKEYLSDYPEITLLKTVIRDRKVYRDEMSAGLGVTEMTKYKAKNEFQMLVNKVLK